MTVCEHAWWGSTWELWKPFEKGGILWCRKCGAQRSWRWGSFSYESPVEEIPIWVAGWLLKEMLERIPDQTGGVAESAL